MLVFGDIVLSRFPFTDLSGDKRRPALVVSREITSDDVILCFITSVTRSGASVMPIAPEPGNGLKLPSYVRLDRIATLNTRLIEGRIGVASPAWLVSCATRFYSVFGFNADQPHSPAPNAL